MSCIQGYPGAKVSIPSDTAGVAVRSGLIEAFRLLVGPYRRRALVCLCLMTAQALFYNSIFFSLTLVLMRFYGATPSRVGYAFLPIAVANFLGPVMLGKLFDTRGRRSMTGGTFILSGILLLLSGLLFWLRVAQHGHPNRLLGSHLFCRFHGRQRSLSQRQRVVPAGDTCVRNRDLLCDRDATRRSFRSAPLRAYHRQRISGSAGDRLCRRRSGHDCSRHRSGYLGSRSGTAVTRVAARAPRGCIKR